MANGDLLIRRFSNHTGTTEPSASDLRRLYAELDKSKIEAQTGTASWFNAELIDAPTFGGVEGETYKIYNPTDGNGNPLTSSSSTYPLAKLCGAPNPPFGDGDNERIMLELLAELNGKVDQIIERFK